MKNVLASSLKEFTLAFLRINSGMDTPEFPLRKSDSTPANTFCFLFVK